MLMQHSSDGAPYLSRLSPITCGAAPGHDRDRLAPDTTKCDAQAEAPS